MRIHTQLTEHAFTGSLFWIGESAVLIALRQDSLQAWWTDAMTALGRYLLAVPPQMSLATNTLVFATIVVLVFLTGLVLDLLASVFSFRESQWFDDELVANRSWISTMLGHHSAQLLEDFNAVITRRMERPSKRESFMRDLRFWDLRSYKRGAVEGWKDWQVHKHSLRLFSFFLSYVSVLSDAFKIRFVADRVYIWRNTRVIFGIVLLLSGQLVLLALADFMAMATPVTASHEDYVDALLPLLITIAVLFIAPPAVLFLARFAFRRVCTSLISLSHVTYLQSAVGSEAKKSSAN